MLEVRLLYQQLAETNRALEFMTLHDPLTGLPNRRLFMDRLTSAITHAKRNKGMMALLYMDLDGFKHINDTLGHEAGDILLKMVADRLTATVRQEDTVARIGGDEFVIVLAEVSRHDAVERLMSKLLLAVAQPYLIAAQQVNMTTSIGVALYPAHGLDNETLLQQADAAMYAAKQAGKNNYRISSVVNSSANTE
jgi:diguanylate cyclase (GGDEF)-like protein